MSPVWKCALALRQPFGREGTCGICHWEVTDHESAPFDEWPALSGTILGWSQRHSPPHLPPSLVLTSTLSLSAPLLRDYWVYIYHWTVEAFVGTAGSFRIHICVRLASFSASPSHVSLIWALLSLVILQSLLFNLFLYMQDLFLPRSAFRERVPHCCAASDGRWCNVCICQTLKNICL